MTITIKQLRYLAAVADHGSLTAAAASLGVTQPVLSRALAALQEELSTPLLQRRHRKLVLTPEGAAIVPNARRASAAVDEIQRTILRKQTPVLLRIAVGTTFGALLASPLRNILEREAEMHVELVLAETLDEQNRLLLTEAADLAFGVRPARDAGLRWRAFDRLELILVSPEGLDLPPKITFEEAAGLRLICTPAATRQEPFDSLFLKAATKPNVVLEAEDISVFLAMAQAGVGSFVGWRFICQQFRRVEIRAFDPAFLVEVGFSFVDRRRAAVDDFLRAAFEGRPRS